jgi:hypothetical protein
MLRIPRQAEYLFAINVQPLCDTKSKRRAVCTSYPIGVSLKSRLLNGTVFEAHGAFISTYLSPRLCDTARVLGRYGAARRTSGGWRINPINKFTRPVIESELLLPPLRQTALGFGRYESRAPSAE